MKLLSNSFVFYDVGRTPDPYFLNLLNRRVRKGVVEHGESTPMDFFTAMGLWDAESARILPSTDSEKETLARLYVLSRSDVMLIDLDNTNCPEMWLAASAGIPIIGVTTRYTLYPVVASLMTVIVQPNTDVILRCIGGLV